MSWSRGFLWELWTLLGSEVRILAANLVGLRAFLIRDVYCARVTDTAELLLVPVTSDVNDSLIKTGDEIRARVRRGELTFPSVMILLSLHV